MLSTRTKKLAQEKLAEAWGYRGKEKQPSEFQGLFWCARLDSNQWPSGSEFPDIQRKAAISSRFSSVVHKDENDIKSPRSLFRTDFAGFCVRGGQMVVRVVRFA